MRHFSTGSLTEIKREKQGKPFILSFWSLDCPSCLKEFNTIAKELNAYPDIKLIMVSTDALSDQDAVAAFIEKQGLKDRVEFWIFAETDDQKLRYEIDASWFGELPRSYLYDANHVRSAQSGALSETQIEAWHSKTR